MNKKESVKSWLVTGLFVLALGGWLLHLRIHAPGKGAAYLVPFVIGIISVFCVPLLFCFRRTFLWGYLINGFSVIIGTITMTHFAAAHFQGPLTPANLMLNTTFSDIALLWGKFCVGQALFRLETLRSETDVVPAGRFFRYPNMGWWFVHAAGLSAVYAAAVIFWK